MIWSRSLFTHLSSASGNNNVVPGVFAGDISTTESQCQDSVRNSHLHSYLMSACQAQCQSHNYAYAISSALQQDFAGPGNVFSSQYASCIQVTVSWRDAGGSQCMFYCTTCIFSHCQLGYHHSVVQLLHRVWPRKMTQVLLAW